MDDYSGDDRSEYLKRFINTFLTSEQVQVRAKRIRKTDKIIEEFGTDLSDDLYVMKIPASEIGDNRALQNIVNHSAIDVRIKSAMALYDELKSKHSRDNSELEDLLNM